MKNKKIIIGFIFILLIIGIIFFIITHLQKIDPENNSEYSPLSAWSFETSSIRALSDFQSEWCCCASKTWKAWNWNSDPWRTSKIDAGKLSS